MDARHTRNRLREAAKLRLRNGLGRLGIGVVRDPYPQRLVRVLGVADIDCVLDVGANVGQFGAQLRSAGYRGRIISFEPQRDAFEVLRERSSRDMNWRVIKAAVGAASGTLEMNLSANSYSSSLLDMAPAHLAAAPGSVFIGTETVDVLSLDELLPELDVHPASTFLKIDTQGYETAVLDGAAHLLSTVAALQLELSFVELYHGQQLFDGLMGRVRDLGLQVWGIEPGFADQQGRMLQCDGLFVRGEQRDPRA